MNYEFHPEAEAEFLESVGFYETRIQGLGEAFINEFELLIGVICESPTIRKIARKPDIRRATFRRFPFSLLYREKESIIQILAVAHNMRRPQYWVQRL